MTNAAKILAVVAVFATAVACNSNPKAAEEVQAATEQTDTLATEQADSLVTDIYANLPEEPEFDIETNMGTIRVKLYSKTPKHRDNFVKLAKGHFYDSLLFHRVIPGFMIQGGDPNSKHAPAGAQLGSGSPC